MPKTAFPPTELLDRRAAVTSVLASFGMEGLEPDAATSSLLDEYVADSISLEQLGDAIELHVARMDLQQDVA
jgi:hypothetical protein